LGGEEGRASHARSGESVRTRNAVDDVEGRVAAGAVNLRGSQEAIQREIVIGRIDDVASGPGVDGRAFARGRSFEVDPIAAAAGVDGQVLNVAVREIEAARVASDGRPGDVVSVSYRAALIVDDDAVVRPLADEYGCALEAVERVVGITEIDRVCAGAGVDRGGRRLRMPGS
jgi:hypothetical protein